MKSVFTSLAIVFLPFVLFAQRDSSGVFQPGVTDGIEDLFQRTESNSPLEITDQLDLLDDLRRKPLDINKADKYQLEAMNLLSATQIEALIAYRKQYGTLLSVYELQAVPEFDLAAIRRIQPFIFIQDENFNSATQGERLTQLQHNFTLRYQREWPLPRGFTDGQFAGSPDALFLRYRLRIGNAWSFGITADRDAGEAFFSQNNKQGFDFYSAHLFWQGQKGPLRAVALGDYRLSIGQGLMYQGGGLIMGKGSGSLNTRRGGRMLQPYTSANESAGCRGAAVLLAPVEKLEFLFYGSSRLRDANLIAPSDTLDTGEEGLAQATSLLVNGLHRTENEIADKHILRHTIIGGTAKYKFEKGHIALNTIHHEFGATIRRTGAPYNVLNFVGRGLTNIGVDYSYRWRNLYFFGEVSKGDQPKPAFVQGLLTNLNRAVDIALLYRDLPAEYHAIDAMPFAEGSNGNNERGLYLGTEIKLSRQFSLQSYVDMWSRPWLQYTSGLPAYGREYYTRLQFSIRRKFDAYLLYRFKENQINVSSSVLDIPLRPVENQTRQQLRLHVQHMVSKTLTLRSRAEMSFYRRPSIGKSQGFLLYQDVLVSPKSSPISGNFRICLFQSEDYNTRFYAFENNVAYFYRIPPLSNSGIRSYINVKYKLVRGLSLEAHYGRTFYRDQNTIGSGNNTVKGNLTQEFVLQARWSVD